MDKYMKRLEQNAQQQQRREISEKKREKKLQGAKGAAGAARARKRPQRADASDSAPGADSQPHKARRKADSSGAGAGKGTGGAGKQSHGGGGKPLKKITKRERDLSRTYGEVVVKAKDLWNVIRERRTPAEKRASLVTELCGLVKDKVADLVMKHDASRVVQSVVKYGTADQRTMVLSELKGKIPVLSRSKHGHFLVCKLLRYLKGKELDEVLKEFRGNCVRMGTHSTAALVLEYAYDRILSPAQCSAIVQEFFGPEFLMYQPARRSLGALLKEAPDKREYALEHLRRAVSKQASKGLLTLSLAHRVAWEYMANAKAADIATLVPTLQDGLPLMMSTKEGARCANLCLAYSGAKERKKFVRAIKGDVAEVAHHPFGHMALVRLLDCTDDTVLIRKSVLAELEPQLLDLACHVHGRKLILHILAPKSRWYFSPHDLELLKPAFLPKKRGDDDQPAKNGGMEEEEEELEPTSKKEPEKRREELLAALEEPLVSLCEQHTSRLLHDRHGSTILFETARVWPRPSLLDAIAERTVTVYDPAEAAAEANGEEDDGLGADGKPKRTLPSGVMLGANAKAVLKGEDDEEDDDDDDDDEEGEEAPSRSERSRLEATSAGNVRTPLKPMATLEHPQGHLVLKRLILEDAKRQKAAVEGEEGDGDEAAAMGATGFAARVWKALRPHLADWATVNRPAFVTAALLEHPDTSAEVLEALRSMREQLKEAGTVPGVKVLLESQGPSPRKTRGRARRESEVATPAKPTPRKRGTPATSARKPRRAKQ